MKKIICISDRDVWLKKDKGVFRLPYEYELSYSDSAEIFCFGNYIAISREEIDLHNEEYESFPLREAMTLLTKDSKYIAKGGQLIAWNQRERYCRRDGVKLYRNSEISKMCPLCKNEYFPSLSPAIVVLVKRGNEVLLVRGRTFKGNVSALVAGFVETGETPEECAAREVKEETGLEIKNIRYLGSQSWPYPDQLMLGFVADYAGEELVLDKEELAEGAFYSREKLPTLPQAASLSRRIIDMWIDGKI